VTFFLVAGRLVPLRTELSGVGAECVLATSWFSCDVCLRDAFPCRWFDVYEELGVRTVLDPAACTPQVHLPRAQRGRNNVSTYKRYEGFTSGGLAGTLKRKINCGGAH